MRSITFKGDNYPTILSDKIRLNKVGNLYHFSKNEIKKYLLNNFEYSTKTKTLTNTYFINPYSVLQKKFNSEYGCYFLTQIAHEEII